MQCKNHPDRSAVDRCAGCAEPFCNDCLVPIQGQKYCGSCKVMAVQGGAVAVPETARTTCKQAKEALIIAIIGIFCFGIILEPMAIYKAAKAKKEIAADPSLGGEGMATAAMIIAILALILWVLGMIVRVSQFA